MASSGASRLSRASSTRRASTSIRWVSGHSFEPAQEHFANGIPVLELDLHRLETAERCEIRRIDVERSLPRLCRCVQITELVGVDVGDPGANLRFLCWLVSVRRREG